MKKKLNIILPVAAAIVLLTLVLVVVFIVNYKPAIDVPEQILGLEWGMDMDMVEDIVSNKSIGYTKQNFSTDGILTYSCTNFHSIPGANALVLFMFDEEQKLVDITYYFKTNASIAANNIKADKLNELHAGFKKGFNKLIGKETSVTEGDKQTYDECTYWITDQTLIRMVYHESDSFYLSYSSKEYSAEQLEYLESLNDK